MVLVSSREVTDRLNISYQTLNFYTNLGLFEIQKRVGNKRYYDEEKTVSRIGRITAMKEEGYPLRIIVRQLNRETADRSNQQDGGLL